MSEWKTRILVVDDEPVNLGVIEDSLDFPEYQLTLVDSGEAAWEALRNSEQRYDLIILDRMMPNMSGLDLLRMMKQEPDLVGIPVIMQTAAASPAEVGEGIEAGAKYYLTKPYLPETLCGIVEVVLNDVRAKKQIRDRISKQSEAFALIEHAVFHISSLKQAGILASMLASICPNPDTASVGLIELLVNAVEHGNLNIGYEEKALLKMHGNWESEIERRLALPVYAQRFVIVTVSAHDEVIEFRIEDQGDGFDWLPYLELSPERAFDLNGRGIAIAHKVVFRHLEFVGNGNVVIARISRS
jgi:CheY-like chemotaxis protein